MKRYDPADKFEIKVFETEFRHTPRRILMARIYQPQGEGPFPVLLDLHGGARGAVPGVGCRRELWDSLAKSERA